MLKLCGKRIQTTSSLQKRRGQGASSPTPSPNSQDSDTFFQDQAYTRRRVWDNTYPWC